MKTILEISRLTTLKPFKKPFFSLTPLHMYLRNSNSNTFGIWAYFIVWNHNWKFFAFCQLTQHFCILMPPFPLQCHLWKSFWEIIICFILSDHMRSYLSSLTYLSVLQASLNFESISIQIRWVILWYWTNPSYKVWDV